METGTGNNDRGCSGVANKFTDRMRLATEEAKAALTKAKDDMACYYNQRRLPTPTYCKGTVMSPTSSRTFLSTLIFFYICISTY